MQRWPFSFGESFENQVVTKKFYVEFDGGDVGPERVVFSEGGGAGVRALFVVLDESEGRTDGGSSADSNNEKHSRPFGPTVTHLDLQARHSFADC